MRVSAVAHIFNFNPRIREGCDLKTEVVKLDEIHFNPRIREGCDVFESLPILFQIHFNPRIREGCDLLSDFSDVEGVISIHASARDATVCPLDDQPGNMISIHASARDATSKEPVYLP